MAKVVKCTHCDGEFRRTNNNQRYCSDACRKAVKAERDKKYQNSYLSRKQYEEQQEACQSISFEHYSLPDNGRPGTFYYRETDHGLGF